MIERALFLVRADQDRVYADYAAALADHFDLFVADVALDVVELARVGVRDDQRFRRKIDNLFEAFRVDVGKIDENIEPLAFAHEIAPKTGESIPRRAARCKNAAAAGSVAARVGQANGAYAKFVKDAQ